MKLERVHILFTGHSKFVQSFSPGTWYTITVVRKAEEKIYPSSSLKKSTGPSQMGPCFFFGERFLKNFTHLKHLSPSSLISFPYDRQCKGQFFRFIVSSFLFGSGPDVRSRRPAHCHLHAKKKQKGPRYPCKAGISGLFIGKE